jgi:hypothetical protein
MKKVIITNKESLTTKLTLLVIGLTAASGLLVPATYASFHPVTTGEIADDTIRSADISNTDGVRTADIVNGHVTSPDIGTGQVASVDIGTGQVASVDIGDGQVGSVDIGTGQVASVDIGDGQVGSADIGDGQVGSVDIGDGQVTTADLASGAIQISRIEGLAIHIPGQGFGSGGADCPSGKILTGGGFSADSSNLQVVDNYPLDFNTWFVQAFNQGASGTRGALIPFALCVQQ